MYTDTEQANETVFPSLFDAAMDYLPIQASAVPSERVFSSSAETDTKKRNRIHPYLMEALQMLKFAFKKDRLNFMDGWSTDESTLSETKADTNEQLLRSLVMEDGVGAADAMDRVIHAVHFGVDDDTGIQV
jgi:hAT family C-terminal dimerisation region